MMHPANVPDVEKEELLARYLTQSSHFRADGTVKQNAFMPPADLKLSVTRHREATAEEIWKVGRDIAQQRKVTLYGRADVTASVCFAQGLNIEAAPVHGNPNHANIGGWPAEKDARKMVAMELATRAIYCSQPTA